MINFLWLVIGFAHAAPSLLTGPMDKSKSQKILLICQKELKSKKNITVRNSRFFVSGQGYRQRVIIEGINNQSDAAVIAKSLYAKVGTLVYLTDDGRQLPYDVGQNLFISKRPSLQPPPQVAAKPSDKAQSSEPKKLIRITPQTTITDQTRPLSGDEKSNDSNRSNVAHVQLIKKVPISSPRSVSSEPSLLQPTPTDVLNMAQKQLGKMSSLWSDADAERLEFTRILFDPSMSTALKANHLFLRDGDAMRLEVEIKEGTGQNSTTVLSPKGKSWIIVGKKSVVRDGNRTKAVLKRFSSTALYSILLNFNDDVETDGPWRKLNKTQKSNNGWRLQRHDEDNEIGVIEAEFDGKTWGLLELTIRQNDGIWKYVFSDYRVLATDSDVLIPYKVLISRNGNAIEEIEIQKMALNTKIPQSSFEGK